MLRKVSVLFAVVALCGISVAQAGTIYNVASDWSITNGNPNGVWTYGECSSTVDGTIWTPNLGGFAPYTYTTTVASGAFAGVTRWDPIVSPNRFIGYNPSDATLVNTGNSKMWPAYTVAFAPNASTDAYIVAWTAPEAGTVSLSSSFFDLQPTNIPLVPMVYLNATQLWSNGNTALPNSTTVGTPGTAVPYATTVGVAAGDKLYFLGTGGNSHTGVNATVDFTPVPEPASILLLATGLVGLLAYAWRKRK